MLSSTPPDLDLEKNNCRQFLEHFKDEHEQPKYKIKLLEIANREFQTLSISLDDIAEFFESEDNTFVLRIQCNARRYIKLLSEAADELMPLPTRTDIPWDLWDEFMSQAQERYLERKKAQMRISLSNPAPSMTANAGLQDEKSEWELPASLKRRFELQLKPRESMEVIPLREVDANHIGHLVKITGIVAQVSDVRPLVRVATYVDVQNGTDYYQEVLGKTFIPLHQAPQKPDQPKLTSGLEFLKDHSKFVSYQEVKIQENQDEVPEGTTPRFLKFSLIGNLTRRVKPGDHVVISGICIAHPYAGSNGTRPGLLATTSVETMDLCVSKVSYSIAEVSNNDLQLIQDLSCEGNIYGRLAQSIAPEIHGHVDIKKALLLMMVGGVTNETQDGMKLRGDIHVCLMGDPGVAKSQLLKFIAHASPRSVYTTGKGSSGVGLTASIVREESSHEACLEGGALVLADRGICCIDEFDKMEESDRTAIHEVMEQQTVSIAKAGITTTLNARTTILAAANPAWGRYNPKKSPAENIALPPALLSRFDIMWLILDKPDASKDRSLSEHILHVHCHGTAPSQDGLQSLSSSQLRAYVTAARSFKPIIPKHLIDYVASVYSAMRQENLDHKRAHTYTTPRTLMSILRMSQALAKLQFRSEVIQDDVEEALRLIQMSKISLIEEDRRGERIDPLSAIYQKMNAYWRSSQDAKQNGISFGKIRELCSGIKLGSRNEKIRECIEEYCELGIINVTHGEDGEPIVFFVCQ